MEVTLKNNTGINGVINVYKEKGYTSHDVVAKLRGILKTKKIGHTGTLDPDAEGVLPVCIGKATKLCDLIMEKTKTYEAELILGITTDTEDMSGNIIKKYEGTIDIKSSELEEVIESFFGEYMQIPPMYSALKINGKKLCDLAREGIEVERKARKVYIYNIDILDINFPIVKIRVKCSKGTYIRTLCKDIGEKLGVYGCMGNLVRTKTGIFDIEESHKLEEIQEICKNDELYTSNILISTDEILCDYPKLYVREQYYKLLANGNPLTNNMFENSEDIRIKDINMNKISVNNKEMENQSSKESETRLYRVYNDEEFVAVYRKDANNPIFKVEKMLV